MKQVASRAKLTVKRIANVPQKIGHTILSVPDTIFNKQQQQQQNEGNDEATLRGGGATSVGSIQHGVLCSNIIDDQKGRIAVRESKEECMKEITDHLKLHLFQSADFVTSYEYEEWIAALHPDNVHHNNNDGSRTTTTIIDHRFYIQDSHHRQLWNEFMMKLECRESIVEARSNIDPTKYRNRTLIDTLVEEPNEFLAMAGDSCCFCP